jgi:hypothetical protein
MENIRRKKTGGVALDNETEEEKEKPIDKCKMKRISRAIPEM